MVSKKRVPKGVQSFGKIDRKRDYQRFENENREINEQRGIQCHRAALDKIMWEAHFKTCKLCQTININYNETKKRIQKT